ncbi:MAG: hypothetical protein GY749_30800 [Desulfobacteraceae bacterium]|nr:hypothetical protein [Desulfobacteraceae bacterium]
MNSSATTPTSTRPQIKKTCSHGELVHNDNGTYTYTPDPGYTGQDSFIYTDTQGQTGKLIIDVVPQNMPPYAEEETHLVMGENTVCIFLKTFSLRTTMILKEIP